MVQRHSSDNRLLEDCCRALEVTLLTKFRNVLHFEDLIDKIASTSENKSLLAVYVSVVDFVISVMAVVVVVVMCITRRYPSQKNHIVDNKRIRTTAV